LSERLVQLYESVGFRDLVEIAILAMTIYAILRFLGKTRGSAVVRGLALVVVGLFLVAQVIISILDLTELSKVLDYLLTTVVMALLVIFQPELRRGLLVLGRYRMFRYLMPENHYPLADRLADAAIALARESIGALIAIQREMALTAYIESGERLDAEVSVSLLRTIFMPKTPLHDGAVILVNGRIAAAACQLPLSQPPDGTGPHMGMRHRAALGLSEDSDAVLLVVSEETGRISLAVGGRLEPVPREAVARKLASLLNRPTSHRLSSRRLSKAG
jgi:diadenylate cyclase